MKKQILLIATLAVLAAVSCSKSDPANSNSGKPGQIKVTSTIANAVNVKAPVGTNDTPLLGVSFVHAQTPSGTPASFLGLQAISGDRAASGDITFSLEQVYDQMDGKTSILMGYYPAGTVTPNLVTWTPDGATDILFTGLWNAGTYSDPVSTGMVFDHALARIEVRSKIATGSSQESAITTWGKITGIKFKDAPTTIVLNLASNTLAAGNVLADLALNSGNTYTTVGFDAANIAPQGSTTVMASAMIPPTGATTCKLTVSSENVADMEVEVSFKDAANVATTCQAGKVHFITLTFNADDKTIEAKATTIEEWTHGGTSENPVTPPAEVAVTLSYGKAPFDITTVVNGGSTNVPYVLFGTVADANNNGAYVTVLADAYATDEKPYESFEIAKTDITATTWAMAQGTTFSGATGSLCAQEFGRNWRLPRIAELKLMHENITKLQATKGGYVKLDVASPYWSGTEESVTNAWAITFNTTGNPTANDKTETALVRCVKDI